MVAVAESFMEESRRRFLQALDGIRQCLRPRVLIADDNAVFAGLLRDALDSRGVTADVALDEGGARMLIARHDDYELLVLDGAYEPQGENVPVLYVSGADLPPHACNCCADGATGCPAVGFKSKADGIPSIADEIASRCGVGAVFERTVP